MASILSNATLVVTNGLTWLSSTVNTIVAQPLLLLFAVLGLIGTGIGLYRRIVG